MENFFFEIAKMMLNDREEKKGTKLDRLSKEEIKCCDGKVASFIDLFSTSVRCRDI